MKRWEKMEHLIEVFGHENALAEIVRGMNEDEMEESYEHITRNWNILRRDEETKEE